MKYEKFYFKDCQKGNEQKKVLSSLWHFPRAQMPIKCNVVLTLQRMYIYVPINLHTQTSEKSWEIWQ